ncbi:Hsp70 family protein [Amantichitinum ursilacus]|uniref:Chaperone protein HscC n=1 Tax=Amantichitinum ursilacus TaxID=857265 RepID=A0A0N0GQQ9_9NEIS|nr:molecular chaperone HscC [Amantichitinum ursilacus]KPC55011.1 Chaperone protein HscC [Amantichitinum ursilacus]
MRKNLTMLIGIDLGTTNSLCAVWRDGAAQLIPNALGQTLTPSVVGLDDEGRVLVGLPARERLITHPQHTAAVFKRYMGSAHQTTLGTQRFRPEELSALVLQSLKADAERFLGEPVTEAVITVPAYFSDAQRKATRHAGELAGLKVASLLNEPTAAALAYGLHQREAESTFLVFDLGGGTFDVSILELFDGVMEVRASAGDNFLGGEDFVSVLIEGFVQQHPDLKRLLDPAHRQGDQFRQLVRKEAERVKRALTDQTSVEFSLVWQDHPFSWTVREDDYARLIDPLLVRLRKPLERALRDSRLKLADLDEIVLAGGASRMPLVRRMVARLFGRLPAVHLNPDEIVAMGAAVQAGLKSRDAALREVVMTDVCPYTLGIETSRQYGPGQFQGGLYLPIIERNTVVPVSRSETVYTVRDNQKSVLFKIYQGESREVKDNVFLGELELDVPPRPAGAVDIEVRFTYTIDGLLETECVVPESGEKKRLLIEKTPGALSADEVQAQLEKLAALKIHPRAQTENTFLLNRAARLYQETLGHERVVVGEALSQFRAILETQDERLIEEGRKALHRVLTDLEGEVLL